MTNCELKSGKIKLGGYKGGRGYCGYYITHFGKKLYLRSTQEFIYAKYLDSIGKYYLTENIVYDIDGKKYKPDFFIYIGNFDKLEKIVEIKYSNLEKSEYQTLYAEFFQKIGIEYEVLSRYDIKKIIRSNVVNKNEINKWRDEFVKQYSKNDYSGEKNPMFGVNHSETTKMKIGEQTKKYFQNPDIRKRHKDARVSYWASELGSETKKRYAEMRKRESLIKNPTVIQRCVECGVEYSRRIKDKNNKKTCSNSCHQKYNWRIGKSVYHGGSHKTYTTKIKKYFKMIFDSGSHITDENYDVLVRYQKSLGTIPKNFGMGKSVIEKYFGSIDNLKKEMK